MKILVCDDDPTVRNILSMILKSLDHEVEIACDGQEAMEKIQARAFDVLITDNKMPRLSGVKLVEKLREMNTRLKVMMITGFPDQLYDDVKNRPLFEEVLIKPFNAKDILERLKDLSVGQKAAA